MFPKPVINKFASLNIEENGKEEREVQDFEELRGNVPKSVPLDFRLENTFALYLYHQYHYPSL